jgi:hypothetical protein
MEAQGFIALLSREIRGDSHSNAQRQRLLVWV